MKLKYYLTGILLFLSVFISAYSVAQEMVFSTSVNASRIGIEDEIEITFSFQNAGQVSDFELPDLSGFSLIGGPFQSQRSNISIINGRREQTNVLSLTYILKPNRKGNFTIPPAKVTIGSNQYETNEVSIEVVDGSLRRNRNQRQVDPFFDSDPFEAMQQQMQRMRERFMPSPRQQDITDPEEHTEEHLHKNLYIKVEVDKKNPYVGEQINVYYKLYTRLPMNLSLSKLPNLNGFWTEDFDIPTPPQPVEEVIDGKTYQVFLLKKSALFPQHEGLLNLDKAEAEGVAGVIERVRSNNPYAPAYRQKEIPVKISSNPVSIRVKALPTVGKPDGFSGAVGRFKVNASVNTHSLTTDEALNYTFEIIGSGNLNLIGNPQLSFPPAFKTFAPEVSDTIQERGESISGKRVFTYSLNPQHTGDFVIPAFEFHYFDPQDQAYKTIQTEEIPISVSAGKEFPTAETTMPRVLHDIVTTPFSSIKPKIQFSNSLAYWSIYPLATLILLVLIWFHRRQQQLQSNISVWKNKKANKVAWKRLSKARKLLKEKDHISFYEEVSKAIWLYLSDKLSIPLATLSKEMMTHQLLNKEIDLKLTEQVNELISECEMALYSPSGSQQQKTEILSSAAELIGQLEKELKTRI